MKKFGFALLVAFLGAGMLNACSDDDKKDDNTGDVNVCVNENSDCTNDTCCDSLICDSKTKKCVAVVCGTEGQSCSNDGASECCTGFDCVNSKCVVHTDEEASAKCSAENPCKEGVCVEGACVKTGDACAAAKASCVDGKLVECAAAKNWGAGEDSDVESGALEITVTTCATNKVCGTYENTTACYEKCEANAADKNICDPDSGADGDSLTVSLTYSCKAVGDQTLYVKSGSENCGTQYCDTTNGKCYTMPVVEQKKALDDECSANSECQSNYCQIISGEKGTCKNTVAPNGECVIDTDCFSSNPNNRCKKEDGAEKGICVTGKLNGETCGNAADCNSEYCDSANNKCDVKPPVTKPEIDCTVSTECTDGKKCGADLKCAAFDKAGLNEECSAEKLCAEGLACVSGHCKLEVVAKDGTACEVKASTCEGDAVVECDTQNMGEGKTYKVTICTISKSTPKTCAVKDGKAMCVEYCAKAGDLSQKCVYDDEQAYTPYTCELIDNKLVNIPGEETKCPNNYTCDPYDNQCTP